MTRLLYRGFSDDGQDLKRGNLGLWYDKFCKEWREVREGGRTVWTLESAGSGDSPKYLWIKQAVEKAVGRQDDLEEAHARRLDLLAWHNGTPLFFKNSYAFATGLGRNHPVENGFAWHHVLGVPYLPGSSVKGMVRAWAEMNAQNQTEKDEIREIFGPKADPSHRNNDACVGTVVFLDALPISSVRLKADIMTPHYGPYYQSEGHLEAPADWHSPIPIPFLTVAPDQAFCFAVLPRRGNGNEDCQKVAAWLTEALAWQGAGAKTAVGYGRFEPDAQAQERHEQGRREAEQRNRIQEQTADKPQLYRQLFTAASEGSWEKPEGGQSFKAEGVIEGWLERLENDPVPEAVELLERLVNIHFEDLLKDPHATTGKMNKQKFKNRQRDFAERLLKLTSGGGQGKTDSN